MSFLKKARTAMDDVQKIQKGLKDMGIFQQKPAAQPGQTGQTGQTGQHLDPNAPAAPSVAAHSTTASSATANSYAAPAYSPPPQGHDGQHGYPSPPPQQQYTAYSPPPHQDGQQLQQGYNTQQQNYFPPQQQQHYDPNSYNQGYAPQQQGYGAPSPPVSYAATSDSAPTVLTPGSTPAMTPGAPSIASPAPAAGNLEVPRSQAAGVPAKLPLTARKNVRDEFEAKKADLEKEFSELLGVPWTIYVDVPGVYSYMGLNDSGGLHNPGLLIREYFVGCINRLKEFRDHYGASEIATINTHAPTHTITLEPTSDPKVTYNSTDFHEGRWRLLFQEKFFGTNTSYAAEKISDVVNAASKSNPAGSGNQPGGMSLNANMSIRDGYNAEVDATLTKARGYLALPNLTFVPNFEANYATLLHYASQKPPKGVDPLREDWERTLGPATLGYFQGFVSQLDWQKFADDDMMQEGFKDVIDKERVEFWVTEEGVQSERRYNDCAVVDGVLHIRAKPSQWWVNITDACDKLSDLL